ncbi:protein kinase, partial [bacterium]|nr:protein kinase [candidate division CSSED10-310 bacterium]
MVRILEYLGSGGFGVVAAATLPHQVDPVAVKFLAGSAPGDMESFQWEYSLLARLSHAGIPRVYSFGRLESALVIETAPGECIELPAGRPYFTMELVRGMPFSSAGRSGGTTGSLRWFARLAAILNYLHGQALVYGDLKPSNIILTDDGPRLIDFGAARREDDPRAPVLGTALYAAPEVVRGMPSSRAGDVFSLGLIMLEFLTTAIPVPASLAERDQWRREALAGLRQQDPGGLSGVLEAMTESDTARRTATTSAVLEELSGRFPEVVEPAAARALKEPDFVGREREWERLDAFYAGPVGILLVTGPEGCGRSRLLREWSLRREVSGVRVLRYQEGGRPGLPAMLDALLVLFDSTGGELDHGAGEGRLIYRLNRIIEGFQPPSGSPPLVVVDGWRPAEGVFADCERGLLNLSDRLPFKLILISGDAVPGPASVARLSLPPLEHGETILLLRSIFQAANIHDDLATGIHRQASGNPAEIIALASFLDRERRLSVRDGCVRADREACRTMGEWDRETLESERLQVLPGDALLLLKVSAWCRQPLSIEQLADFYRRAGEAGQPEFGSGIDSIAIAATVLRLEQDHLVEVRCSVGGRRIVTARSESVAEKMRGLVPRLRQADWHRLAAETLEAIG